MSLVPATGVHEIGLWRRRIGHLPLQIARRGQIRQQVSTQNAHNGVLLDAYHPRGRRELPFHWGQHRLPLRESAAPAEDNRLGVPERRHLPLGHRRRTIRFPAAAAGRYASSAERLARVRSCLPRKGVSRKSASDAVELDTSPSKHRIHHLILDRCPHRTRRMAILWTPVFLGTAASHYGSRRLPRDAARARWNGSPAPAAAR